MKQLSTFVFPTVVSLPQGYDCTFSIDLSRIRQRLGVPNADLVLTARRYYEGSIVEVSEQRLHFENRELVSGPPKTIVWRDQAKRDEAFPSFADVALTSVDDIPVFADKAVVTNYSIYTKPGKKAFFSDNAYKYGAPPVISMMAKLGRFVEGYPAIHIDRERDFGESLLLINPYLRPVLARIVSSDERTPVKVRVPPQSVRRVPLTDFLREGENSWIGRLQLNANNRLITFHLRHSLADPSLVSDHEHLDPFRTERTHLPISEAVRISLAGMLRRMRRSLSQAAKK